MKVSWWKALGLVGLVADELTKAGVDNRVTVDEAIQIVAKVAPAAGLTFDSVGGQFTMEILTKIMDAAADGKITIRELVAFAEGICAKYGIDFDKEGIEV